LPAAEGREHRLGTAGNSASVNRCLDRAADEVDRRYRAPQGTAHELIGEIIREAEAGPAYLAAVELTA
jgi:hypothetical protein